MTTWRFLDSGHLPPSINMAIDNALIDIYATEGIPIFRIYGWHPPGFSIGCSQNAEAVLDVRACGRDGIPIVKRATGGGIIYHCREATYSIVCKELDIGTPLTVKEGYRTICSFLLESYRRLGLNPRFSIDCNAGNKIRSSFCFSSFEDYDILIDGRKIGGNAQKWRRKIILQHGSIPLDMEFPPVLKYVKEPVHADSGKITSLKQSVGRAVSFEEFSAIMRESFCKVFDAQLEKRELTDSEKDIVNKYEQSGA